MPRKATLKTAITGYLLDHCEGERLYVGASGDIWLALPTESNSTVCAFFNMNHIKIVSLDSCTINIEYADPKFFDKLHKAVDELGTICIC